MTRQSTKRKERFFAAEVARLLGENWIVEVDRECSDFVVAEGARKFGLEVCEVFAGPQSSSGAHRKMFESTRQRGIGVLRSEYESRCDVALHVRFVGDICADNLATAVPALIAEDLSSKPKGFRIVMNAGRGLRVYATCELRPRWYRVDDRV